MEKEEQSIYDEMSAERKLQQQQGLLPMWYTTAGYQLFKAKYLAEGETGLERYTAVAKTAAQYMPNPEEWEKRFFEVMWKGYLSPATPVLSNMGKPNGGCSVSCAGAYVDDSIYDFYDVLKEQAVLSKNAFGTSVYLGDIRERGAPISGGGTASGLLPVVKDYIQMAQNVSQGGNRRGSIGLYIPASHKDFYEVADHLFHNPDDCNIGWIFNDGFYERLKAGGEAELAIWQRICYIRATIGRGYMMKEWVANEQRPQMYKDHGLDIKASNLCSEIMLHSDPDHTFTCVLSSMNLEHWDEWKDTDAVYVATVFLDCVVEHFLTTMKGERGMEKAIRFTEKGRAIGLGVLGYHSYLQNNMIPFESFDAMMWNGKVFRTLNKESLRASQDMAQLLGEPEWCVGYGVRNTHRIAVAPTMSTSLLVGGVSQGIEPYVMNVYSQSMAGGTVRRINPVFLKLMKERGVYNKETLKDIEDNVGSCQHVDWMSDHEKEVFKTAFEINQLTILQAASQRQPDICQGQSLNTFFDSKETEEWISHVLSVFMEDPNLIALYYQRSESGVKASKGECVSCHA